jgi:molecular chaperone GrpE
VTEKEERLDEELDKTAEETAETTESSNESTETEAQTPQPEEETVEKSELELLQEKNNELEDQFLRARAEIANITSRNRNERELLQKYRSQDLGKKTVASNRQFGTSDGSRCRSRPSGEFEKRR